jgi:hypothetical protein
MNVTRMWLVCLLLSVLAGGCCATERCRLSARPRDCPTIGQAEYETAPVRAE